LSPQIPHMDVIERTWVLQGFSPAQLRELLASSPVLTFRRNDVVFEENSYGRELYVVLEGAVAVKVDPARLGTIERGSIEPRVIRTLGPGESFGEMALIGERGREAAIVAVQDRTKLLKLELQSLYDVPRAQQLLANIAFDLSDKLQAGNSRLIESILSTYYLTALVEELASGAYECSPIIPLQKPIIIKNAESFILSGPGHLLPTLPQKEAIELSIFASPTILQQLAGPGSPSGMVVFNALFAILRTGAIPDRIVEEAAFRYEPGPHAHQRTGKLVITRINGGTLRRCAIEWQLKGAHYCNATKTASAFLFLYIYDDDTLSTWKLTDEIIANIAMPVQKSIAAGLSKEERAAVKTRVIIIHHRTHEVARTLRTIRELGYCVDTFIGIPYGDVGWDYITILDQSTDHNYLSLQLVTHPTNPTHYQFDFRQSSFLDRKTEQDLCELFEDPHVNGDYMSAMHALAEYRLLRALQTCRERGDRLIVYEDGGYFINQIYAIYRDPLHPSYDLVKEAVDTGVITGVVEVTVAGERKNLHLITENGGNSLLPVLSNARSDLKAIYESMGVGEAVIHAAATALGRLGLPTFQSRRVVVIGGNGAIGTRLVEQFVAMHNSTANVFVVDPVERAFRIALDFEVLPFAASRLEYRALPRYVVKSDCVPVVLPRCNAVFEPNRAKIADTIQVFLADWRTTSHLAIANSYPLSESDLRWLWQQVESSTGYSVVAATPLPEGAGAQYQLDKGGGSRVVTLLVPSIVFAFNDVSRLIRNGIDTIVGSTGYSVFSSRDLAEFLGRSGPVGQTDELVLISSSSKDIEFRHAIDLLHILLKIHSQAPVPGEVRLGWFAAFYRDAMSFVRDDDDYVAIRDLLASPREEDAFEAFRATAPGVARAAGLTDENQVSWQECIADFITQKVCRAVSIRKEIRPDIGSIYHLVVNGRTKRVVLLADGLVVNFFAKHEKGVKTEYIDPIVTMQLLSLVKLSTNVVPPGLHKMDTHLRLEDMRAFWNVVNENCRPLGLRD
jgi:CRP-like cAMP-binding protein